MRHAVRRVLYLSAPNAKECMRCQQYPLLNCSTIRGYATTEDEGVSSTLTGPDPITTESPSLQAPPSSPLPPSPSKAREPWHFRLPPQKMDSAARQKEINRAVTETSLRKKLHWYTPLHGINPAYDMATIYLQQDRSEKIQMIRHLEDRIKHERESIPFSVKLTR
jgi:hypothetical protein